MTTMTVLLLLQQLIKGSYQLISLLTCEGCRPFTIFFTSNVFGRFTVSLRFHKTAFQGHSVQCRLICSSTEHLLYGLLS